MRLPPYVLGFLVRAVLALVHAYLFALPDSQADALMFERAAWEMAEDSVNGIASNFTTGALFLLLAYLHSIHYFRVEAH